MKSNELLYDHYYTIETKKDFIDGHIFCTIAEAEEIEQELKKAFPKARHLSVSYGGDYDYTTEAGQMTAAEVADSIIMELR